MSRTLWLALGASVFFVVGFVLAMRSILRENRDIDKHIDYSKLRPPSDDEDEDDQFK